MRQFTVNSIKSGPAKILVILCYQTMSLDRCLKSLGIQAVQDMKEDVKYLFLAKSEYETTNIARIFV